MSRILFIDPVTPKPYTIEDLNKGRMGGTEATELRVARELSKRHVVTIAQRGRAEEHTDGLGVRYIPLEASAEDPNVVVTLRDAKSYREAIQSYGNSVHYLWLHDVVSGEYADHMRQCLENHPTTVLTVSQWHRNNVLNALGQETIKGNLKALVMYNPIEDYCQRLNMGYDNKKLIYYSSPHKGLDQVLEAFAYLRLQDPEFRLYVANPGYYPDQKDLPEGVIDLSSQGLSHFELMNQVRSSLCMFYPQTTFEETFGLVYAESNGVGTPVIGHNLGAAQEVLDNNHQLINCTNIDAIVNTALQWSKGKRPTVSGNKLFSMSEVIKAWNKLIKFGNVG